MWWISRCQKIGNDTIYFNFKHIKCFKLVPFEVLTRNIKNSNDYLQYSDIPFDVLYLTVNRFNKIGASKYFGNLIFSYYILLFHLYKSSHH